MSLSLSETFIVSMYTYMRVTHAQNGTSILIFFNSKDGRFVNAFSIELSRFVYATVPSPNSVLHVYQ